MSPSGRAGRIAALFALPPAVVVGLVVGLVANWIVGAVLFVVLGAALLGWARLAGDRLVAARLGGRPADPASDARLWNLVEGLSTGAGVRQPRLIVVDSPALNAMAAGGSPDRTVLAVTNGLLSELDRIELEAVLAEALFQIRHQETIPGTVLVSTFGLGARWALLPERDTVADQGAITLTRYPPALASALEKIQNKGAAVPSIPARMAHLWLADPRPDPTTSRARLALHDRIEALREL